MHAHVRFSTTNGTYRNTNIAHSREALRLLGGHVSRDIFGGKTGKIILSLAQTEDIQVC